MIAKLLKVECMREMRMVYRSPALMVTPLLFYVFTSSVVPLSLDSSPQILQLVAPGMIWLMLIFSMMLSQHNLFERDYQSGVLEQFLLLDIHPYFIALARLLAYALTYALPLLLIMPILALMWRLNLAQAMYVFLTIACGLPSLVVIVGLLNVLTLGSRASSALVPLLLLPLITPVIIFATGSVNLVMLQAVSPYLLIILAISLLSVAFGPLAIGFMLSSYHY